MTLMVNGKKVLGYAIGGNEFYSLDKNADGLINIGGQNYFNTNKMNIRVTDSFNLYLGSVSSANTLDVTNNLSNYRLSDYRGYLAILKLDTDYMTRPFSIPTTTTTDSSLSFYDSYWSGSLSMNTDDTFQLTVSYSGSDQNYFDNYIYGRFYILSHDAS